MISLPNLKTQYVIHRITKKFDPKKLRNFFTLLVSSYSTYHSSCDSIQSHTRLNYRISLFNNNENFDSIF